MRRPHHRTLTLISFHAPCTVLVLAPDGLQPPFGNAAADATPPADETHGAADHRSDEAPLVALPLGHADALSQGDELVLLGYGQPSTSHTSTVTPICPSPSLHPAQHPWFHTGDVKECRRTFASRNCVISTANPCERVRTRRKSVVNPPRMRANA